MGNTAFTVSYLYQTATLADRFYGLVYDLSGREKAEIYYNPGTSLRSFLIAFGGRTDIIELSPEMTAIANECEDFESDIKALDKINTSLMTSASDLFTQMTSLPQDIRLNMLEGVNQLNQLAQLVKATFDAVVSTQEKGFTKFNLKSLPALNYKKALFDMQDKIEEITHFVDKAVNPEPTKA